MGSGTRLFISGLKAYPPPPFSPKQSIIVLTLRFLSQLLDYTTSSQIQYHPIQIQVDNTRTYGLIALSNE